MLNAIRVCVCCGRLIRSYKDRHRTTAQCCRRRHCCCCAGLIHKFIASIVSNEFYWLFLFEHAINTQCAMVIHKFYSERITNIHIQNIAQTHRQTTARTARTICIWNIKKPFIVRQTRNMFIKINKDFNRFLSSPFGWSIDAAKKREYTYFFLSFSVAIKICIVWN